MLRVPAPEDYPSEKFELCCPPKKGIVLHTQKSNFCLADAIVCLVLRKISIKKVLHLSVFIRFYFLIWGMGPGQPPYGEFASSAKITIPRNCLIPAP